MDSPLKWILGKFSPIKAAQPIKSSSKEKAPKSPKRAQTPEKKIKKVRLLEARARAPLF